jgi:hypothetical protein
MFDFFRKFPWVLEPCRYDDQKRVLANLEKSAIQPRPTFWSFGGHPEE